VTGEFKTYRQKNGYSEKTIKVQNSHVNRFTTWCIKQNIQPENIIYNQVLQFIDYERERGIQNQSIIREINSIRVYFDYLLESGTIRQNIIKRIRIRQGGKKVLPETLSPQQLEKIYHDFTSLPEWEHRTKTAKLLHQRNIVILGLLVYQGMDSGEVGKLETSHINLNEGKIYIPSTRKSNARTLKLQANQILPIKTYLEETRPTLMADQKPSTYLFTTKKHSDMICKIVEQIKKNHPEIKDSRQIRASIIMNWLKTNNIRQVQYMAGHKNIRSTEAYRNHDLTDLTRQLELFHPMK